MKRPDSHNYFNAIIQTTAAFILAMIICAIIGALCSCSRKIYVPVENTVIRTDTVYQARLHVDSVILRDSVAVMQKGDTIFMTKYRDRYRLKLRTDTVYQSATDSVKVSVPCPVERELTKWERVRMDAGGFILCLGAAVALMGAIALVVKWIVRKKRRM